MEKEIQRKVQLFLVNNCKYNKIALLQEQVMSGETTFCEVADAISFMYGMGLLNDSLQMNRNQYTKWEMLCGTETV